MGFVIVDLQGLELTSEERDFLRHPHVAGVIIFTRNYESPDQLRALTKAITNTRESLLIVVDQEGGRVQRFRDGFTTLPSMQYWGDYFQKKPEEAKKLLRKTIHTMVQELQSVGIHASLVPVLDVDQGMSEVIGERSFGGNPKQVLQLAEVVIDAMHANGMPATGKHYPGHGAVAADSHQQLPIDYRDREIIFSVDLLPFVRLSRKLDAVMPAHVIYEACDTDPASFSSYWLQAVLRQQIHFQGVVISDDLSMAGAAAMGNYSERAEKALRAGCDLIPVCNNHQGLADVLDHMKIRPDSLSQRRVEIFVRACTTSDSR